MGTSLGFYFRLPKADANQVRADLADLAKAMGYTATAGPTFGEGNPAELMVAIASGEVVLVLIPEDHRPTTAAWLRQQAANIENTAEDFASLGLAEDLVAIAEALQEGR